MDTYGSLHAGDVIRGADGYDWRVAQVVRVGALEVVLTRGEVEVKGYPDPGTPVQVLQRSDVSAEYAAAAALIGGFGWVEIMGERWS